MHITIVKNNKLIRSILFLISLMFAINTTVCMAQEVDGKAYLNKIDGIGVIAIRLNIAKGNYLYHTDLGDPKANEMPLKITLSNDTYKIKSFATSKPILKTQELFSEPGKTIKVNAHTGTAYIYLILSKNNKPSPTNSSVQNAQNLEVYLSGQMCNTQRCLQLSLTLPVDTELESTDVKKIFELMPNMSEFSKPPLSWSKPSMQKNSALDPTIANMSSSCKFKNLLNQSMNTKAVSQEIPSLLKDTQQNTTELPKFHIKHHTAKYGLIVWLGIAIVAGILLNFMPCVLPVISLKLMGFVNQAHESRKRLILLSICFSAGILTVFFALALAAVFFGLQWGEQFQSELFNIILVCLVFSFALSFFGIYEIQVPEFAGKLQKDGVLPREGYLGTYCTGILATLMATPCSGPFLGATISWALTQTAFTVIAVFLCLGFGMALPYFLLSMSSRLRKFLPKPGGWMLTFRVSMGFVLLLTVIYLMIFIKTQNLVSTCALLVFIAFSCWIFGKYGSIIHRKRIRWLARLSSIAIIFLGTYLSFYVFKPFLSKGSNTAQYTQGSLESEHNANKKFETIRHPFDFTAFRNDLSSGKNVLVKFTADWCPNCQYNSHYVFSNEEVLDDLKNKNVVFYEADMTDDTPQTRMIRDLLKSIGGSAIPYVGIFPADAPESPYVLPDILTVSEVINTLNKLPNN